MLGALASGPVHAAADPVAVRRLLALLDAVGREYDEAFDDAGALARPAELQEALLLLAEARDQGARLGDDGPAGFASRLASIERSIDARVPAAAVLASVGELRDALRSATGVAEDVLPAAPPSAARGAALFREHCVSCHGEQGRGDGADARRLDPGPADFTDPGFMRAETPADFFGVISLGRRQAAMPAWEQVLSTQERWDLVSHIWSLGTPRAAILAGRRLFVDQCAGCHDALRAPPGFATLERLAPRSDADLERAIADGVPATPAHVFRTALGDEQRWQLVAFLRATSLALAEDPVAGADLQATLGRVRQALEAADTAYRLREEDAADLATDAYLVFEPLEPPLAERDPTVVRRVEEEFGRLRAAMRQRAPAADVEHAMVAVRRALDGAEAAARRTPAASGLPIAGTAGVVLLVGAVLWTVSARGRRTVGRALSAVRGRR